MNVTRRTFIRNAGGAIVASTLGFDVRSAYAQAQELKISKTTETRSTCPYCAVACGVIIHTLGDKAKNVTAQVVHVEGDPDRPTNRGTLCPKGSSLYHDILNDRRLLKAAGPTSRLRSLGTYSMGSGVRRNRAPHQEAPATNRSSQPTPRAAPSTAAKTSPGSAAAPIRTSSIIWSSRPCAVWGWLFIENQARV